MESGSDIVKLMKSLGVSTSLEDYLAPIFKYAKFSGVGIVAKAPLRVLARILRKA